MSLIPTVNIINPTVALFLLQAVVVIFASRLLALLGGWLTQPQSIFEIIGGAFKVFFEANSIIIYSFLILYIGIILGPSVLGKWTTYYHFLFPSISLTYLDLVANIGLQLYLFIVGLELNLNFAFVNWRSSVIIAISSIVIPFLAGLGVSVVMYSYLQEHPNGDSNVTLTFAFFIGTAMSITAFPILARIIKESGLQNTIVGSLTISAASFNDAVAWILLIIAISLSSGQESGAGWVCLAAVLYIALLFTIGRIGFSKLVAYLDRDCLTPSDSAALDDISLNETTDVSAEGHARLNLRNSLFSLTLALLFLSAWITFMIGLDGIIGSFAFGLIVPRRSNLYRICIFRLEEIVLTFFLPLYFASSGLKTDLTTLHFYPDFLVLLLVCLTASMGKFLGTGISAYFCGYGARDVAVIAVLMNTRGLVELIVLNVGLQTGILSVRSFSVMVIMCIFTTILACPLVQCIYPPSVRTYIEAKITRLGQGGHGVDSIELGLEGETGLGSILVGETLKWVRE